MISDSGRHVERVIVKDGTVVYYSPDLYSDGSRVAVTTTSIPDAKKEFVDHVIDPLVVGMVAESFGHLPTTTVDALLGGMPINSAVQEDGVDGTSLGLPASLVKVGYDSVNGTRVTLWISPAQGNSLVRAEIEGRHPSYGLISSAMQAHQAQFEAGDVWFPRTVRFTRSIDGRVSMDETITILRASFNEPIAESEFSMTALEIRPGTEVIELSEESSTDRVWNGERAVDLGQLHADAIEPTDARKRTNWLRLIAFNCALLAVIAFVCFLWNRGRAKV